VNVSNSTYYQYDYPKSEDITPQQKTYISNYVKNMEKSLYNETFSGAGSYHEYLNDTSFIDFMIMNELAKNVDGYRLSSYLYKGKNEVLNCGPLWDFNLTYGNADYYDGWNPIGFEYQIHLDGDYWQNPFWWNKLMKDPSYVTKLKRRWSGIRKVELSDQRINFVADSLVDVLAEAQTRNYIRWKGVIGNYVWPNYYVGTSYAAEVTWMRNWIDQRLAYLDKQWFYDFTGNDDLMASHSASVYPNPFTDRLDVQLSNTVNGACMAALFNTSGSLIWKNNINVQNGLFRLDFESANAIQSGLYLLKVTRNNQTILTQKVVKGF
jgi:hypothetical protein